MREHLHGRCREDLDQRRLNRFVRHRTEDRYRRLARLQSGEERSLRFGPSIRVHIGRPLSRRHIQADDRRKKAVGARQLQGRRTRRPAAETREHVLAVAHDLFYLDGISRTGVDRVVAAAGIGPTTLYRLFDSKDGLVTAYVELEAAAYVAWMTDLFEGKSPRDGLRAFMRGIVEQVESSRCRGCPFQLTLGEIPDPGHPAHRAAVALKRCVRDLLRDLAARAGAVDPETIGDHLMLLVEGSYAAARSLDSAAISIRAVDAALACLPA